MYKIAEMTRDAEVRGVLACFVDGGHLKVASAEDFDVLSDAVSQAIGEEEYSVEKIAAVTDAVLEEAEYAGTEKTAEERHDTACMAAMGELLMMKVAGEVDDETFVKEANSLRGLWEGGKDLSKRLYNMDFGAMGRKTTNYLSEGFKGTKLRDASKLRSISKKQIDTLSKKLRDAEKKWNRAKARGFEQTPKSVLSDEKRQIIKDLARAKSRKGTSYLPGILQSGLAYGGAAGGVGGAGYLGKKLYDKYSD